MYTYIWHKCISRPTAVSSQWHWIVVITRFVRRQRFISWIKVFLLSSTTFDGMIRLTVFKVRKFRIWIPQLFIYFIIMPCIFFSRRTRNNNFQQFFNGSWRYRNCGSNTANLVFVVNQLGRKTDQLRLIYCFQKKSMTWCEHLGILVG